MVREIISPEHSKAHLSLEVVTWRTTRAVQPDFRKKLERATRFERATPTLARLCSTPELRPRSIKDTHRGGPPGGEGCGSYASGNRLQAWPLAARSAKPLS